MVCCAAYGCSNNSGKGTLVTFHRFPNDKALRDKWSSAMKRKGFQPTLHSKVCSTHFMPTDFELLGNDGKPLKLKRLKRDAVPSIFTSGLPDHLQAPAKKPRTCGNDLQRKRILYHE